MAKIIIVEDDINLANVYRDRLVEDKHEVSIVQDKEAISAIKVQKPDLVLLDVMMPNISGIQILKSIRSDKDFENTPVLMLTNDEKAGDMELAIEMGIEGYILKAETDINALAFRVQSIFEERKVIP